MRDAQRAYVRTCTNFSGVVLLEQEIDALLADALRPERSQAPASLFPTVPARERSAMSGGR